MENTSGVQDFAGLPGVNRKAVIYKSGSEALSLQSSLSHGEGLPAQSFRTLRITQL